MEKDNTLNSQGPSLGVPTVTARGESVFVLQENTVTSFPSDLPGPLFLGARNGHRPILINCGNCGYNGYSEIRNKKGVANVIGGLCLLVIGYFLPFDDTHHFCPMCGAHLAYAKYF